MKRLSDEEILDLTSSSSVEEFLVKKNLLKNGPFNGHDSYELIAILVAQRKEELAWKLLEKKTFTINSYFYWKNANEHSRQKYIEDGMQRFADVFARTAWPSK